ncbi:MAG: hemin-degrading factor [Flavobacteriales bacterium]|nr:hemin-degrading factor [Flavobacteriales bacterium]
MSTTESVKASVSNLQEIYNAYKENNPQARIRNAAQDLGVSELELLCLSLGETVTALQGPFEDFLKEVKSCKRVMALTRNDAAVHERKGEYKNVSFTPHAGLVLGEEIDLRLFMNRWKFGFAVEEPFKGEKRCSFQFFDATGEAVHKIYMTESSDMEAYAALVEKYKASADWTLPLMDKKNSRPAQAAEAQIDKNKFAEAWLNLKDTHDFYLLLRDFRISRTQALRNAPEGHAIPVGNDFHRNMLEKASETGTEIMVFIGNPGCIQIHTGTVSKLLQTGPWYNVLDEDFNMHLNETLIKESWVVKKPTADGIVTSLECYDASGEIIVQFFGKRKPGTPENENWRSLISDCM